LRIAPLLAGARAAITDDSGQRFQRSASLSSYHIITKGILIADVLAFAGICASHNIPVGTSGAFDDELRDQYFWSV
jgi:hypothetical protein